MSNIFHCAVLGGDLEIAEKFYTEILGCRKDNFEAGRWMDIDFWGNELTLHQSHNAANREYHNVDMGRVPVPHFGIHLERDVYFEVKKRIMDAGVPFIEKPYVRFAGTEYEQETFFIEDTNYNVIEIKSMVNSGHGLA